MSLSSQEDEPRGMPDIAEYCYAGRVILVCGSPHKELEVKCMYHIITSNL